MFALVAHSVLIIISKQIAKEFDYHTEESAMKLLIAFLDDGYALGKHDAVIRVAQLLSKRGAPLPDPDPPQAQDDMSSSQATQIFAEGDVHTPGGYTVPRHLYNLAHDSGLHLNLAKSPLWWPTHPEPEVVAQYEQLCIPVVREDGILALKVPIGSEDYVREQMRMKVEALRDRLDILGEFENTQVALLILRVCMGVCRINFLLRALPQPLTVQAATQFDEMQRLAFTRISGAVITDETWVAVQLPIATKDVPGVGISSDVSIASAAYLASKNAAIPVFQKTLQHAELQRISTNPSTIATYTAYKARAATTAPTYSDLCIEKAIAKFSWFRLSMRRLGKC